MIKVNLIEPLVMKKIRDTYQAMSAEEKEAYDKKIEAEEARRRQAWENRPVKEFKKKGANGPEIPGHVERSFRTPARLMHLNGNLCTVPMTERSE